MSGVSVTEGNPLDEDLSAIYQGGQNFLARMQAMSDRRAAAEHAVANMNLGHSVQAALADATTKQVSAAKLEADAKAIVDAARATAHDLSGKASEEANSLLTAAKAQVKALKDEAAAIKDAADKHSAETRTAADAALAHASGVKDAASRASAEVLALRAELQAAKNEAEQAKTKADALAAELKAKIAKVTSALNEATKGT
jgi:colicin import membrane protein